MMQHAKRHYSLDDYFAVEEMSEVRHEYFDGEIFAMSGGSRNHNRIARSVAKAFDGLHGCEPYLNDLRVKTPAGLYTYPDVIVVCEPAALTPDRLETITNPIVIVEVLSTSTRDYDRGQKFELYQAIPSLRDYLLIDQYTIGVEHRFLDRGEWQSRSFSSVDEIVQFTGVPVTLRVADAYDRVVW